jgi:hypothetical protein
MYTGPSPAQSAKPLKRKPLGLTLWFSRRIIIGIEVGHSAACLECQILIPI